MSKKYVVGFYFSTDKKSVILIKKNRPEGYVGKINGVGGKIEENEDPIDAMSREFFEETGLIVYDWNNYCRFKSEHYDIFAYRTFGDETPETVTDEEVKWYEIEDVLSNGSYLKFDSLNWLISMGLDLDIISSEIEKKR